MEEENKVVEQEPVEEKQPVAQEENGGSDANKFSLITFILSCVGFTVLWAWIVGGIAGVILGLISLKRLPNSQPTRNPYKVFDRISKPVAIVDIALGAVMAVVYTITTIVAIVAAIAEAGK